MSVDLPWSVATFAALIEDSGSDWRNDPRVIYRFRNEMASDRCSCGCTAGSDYLTVAGALDDLKRLIDAEGPDWLSDWYTVGEAATVLEPISSRLVSRLRYHRPVASGAPPPMGRGNRTSRSLSRSSKTRPRRRHI